MRQKCFICRQSRPNNLMPLIIKSKSVNNALISGHTENARRWITVLRLGGYCSDFGKAKTQPTDSFRQLSVFIKPSRHTKRV